GRTELGHGRTPPQRGPRLVGGTRRGHRVERPGGRGCVVRTGTGEALQAAVPVRHSSHDDGEAREPMTDGGRLSAALEAALIDRLTAQADDEVILGHRNAEWTGHAPLLEEDIALANLAQDEIGHAITWYGLRAELDGSDPDRLVFFREAGEFLSSSLVAL